MVSFLAFLLILFTFSTCANLKRSIRIRGGTRAGVEDEEVPDWTFRLEGGFDEVEDEEELDWPLRLEGGIDEVEDEEELDWPLRLEGGIDEVEDEEELDWPLRLEGFLNQQKQCIADIKRVHRR